MSKLWKVYTRPLSMRPGPWSAVVEEDGEVVTFRHPGEARAWAIVNVPPYLEAMVSATHPDSGNVVGLAGRWF